MGMTDATLLMEAGTLVAAADGALKKAHKLAGQIKDPIARDEALVAIKLSGVVLNEVVTILGIHYNRTSKVILLTDNERKPAD